MSTLISERLDAVRQRIKLATAAAGRREDSIRLIAVSKTQPVSALIAAYRHGQRDFGESYVQEAVPKQDRLAHFDIRWHFIGPLQSNKTRLVAARFAWVHSIDRIKTAERLSEQRPSEMPPLNVCLQVNVSGEASKSGISVEALPDLASAVMKLPRLRLRGLMAIPEPAVDIERQRASFRAVRRAFERHPEYGWDSLSMGMSEDLEAAVLEGSTMVRIGTALFGPRRE